jgi:hypothetical protein
MSDRETALRMITDEIEHYLMRNPHAADSSEGIRRWWLSEPLREESLVHVEAALDRLVERAIMVKSVLEGGHVIYARKPTP